MKITPELLEKAIAYATDKHKGVKRKGDDKPYILHPMSVMTTLLAVKKSKNALLLATVAILHDVVEDCNVSLQEIAVLFGHTVAAMVNELTNDSEKIKELGKTEYLKQKMIAMSSYALCVKLVDRLDNIKDMKSMSFSFQQKQIVATKEILSALEIHRKLTKTHKILIKMIRKEMEKY